jgi:hypothetical protein
MHCRQGSVYVPVDGNGSLYKHMTGSLAAAQIMAKSKSKATEFEVVKIKISMSRVGSVTDLSPIYCPAI